MSDGLTVNARGEFFNDPDGAAPRQYDTARPVSAYYGRPVGRPNNFTEATLGATVKPFAGVPLLHNLALRPEVRIDYAGHPTWDAGTGHYQFTAEIEGFYAF